MKLDIAVKLGLDDDTAGVVAQILALITAIDEKVRQMAIDFTAIKTEITELKSVNAGVKALLADLKTRLDALLAIGDPAVVVAELQSLRDELDAETNALAAAAEANTPAA
jgi:hypothetical protein